LKETLKNSDRAYGVVHKATPAVMNDCKGWLIWDYILYNELTFKNDKTGSIVTLFHSLSDEEMDKRFNEFAEKYGSSNSSNRIL
jgi:hypothetical protein